MFSIFLQHPDHYSRTKSIAEKKVLAANGTDGLCTCALRLAGVYGPGEKRHIPRTLVRHGLIHICSIDAET